MGRRLAIIAALMASGCSGASEEVMTRAAVEAYIDGLTSGDVSAIPLAQEVSFVGPMAPDGLVGAEAVRSFLAEVATGLEVFPERILIDGQYACAPGQFTVQRLEGEALPGVDCFRVVEGEIVQVRPYFDPRPLLPN